MVGSLFLSCSSGTGNPLFFPQWEEGRSGVVTRAACPTDKLNATGPTALGGETSRKATPFSERLTQSGGTNAISNNFDLGTDLYTNEKPAGFGT